MPNYAPVNHPNNLKTRFKKKDDLVLAKRTTSVKLPVGCHDLVWSIPGSGRSPWLRIVITNALDVRKDTSPIQQAIISIEKGDLAVAIAKLKEYQKLVELPAVEEKEVTA